MIYTGTYLKTLPDPKKDSPELIRAFVAGYLMADGERNYQKDGKQYGGIQASNKESIKFIREIFPVAGVHIISETDYTDQETNYGIRPYTIRFTTCDSSGSKYNSGWKVKSITPAAIETVWCLEVENDHSFILDGGIVTGNCTSSYADRPAFFGEYFYILLCGCGAGFSVQKHHIAKLPMIRPRTKQPKTHTITDDIEGWATALDVLLSSFFIGGGKYPEYEGRRVFFEYHKIRDKNSPISGGFKAPGPEPLKKALNKIEELLNRIAENGILRAIDIYDILMHAADAVISGGVRRAATICLFSKDDTEMLSAKTGNWFEENPQRARSNNSVVFKRNEVTLEEFLSIMKYVREFGEPGFVFVSSLEHCFNPCVSADTWIDTENGLKQVKSLINNPFTAIVDGKPYPSKGFWKTGTKELFEISTNRGYTLKVTDNHKILIEKNKERLWIEVKYLNIGDNIVMNDNMDTHFHINLEEKEKGWLLGEVIGDGCHNPEKYDSLVRFWGKSAKQMANKSAEIFSKYFPSRYEGRNAKPQYNKINDSYMVSNRAFTEFCSFYLEPETKNLLENAIENMSPSFISGLISGLFDSDGHVSFSSNKNSRSIRLTQNNLPRLKMIQILLSKLGIPSTIYEDRHPEKSWENYESTPIHEIHISRNGIDRFHEIIGFSEPNKQRILEEMQSSKKRQTYRDKFVSKITAIKKIGTEDVYDCTIEDIHCFSANGLIVHNCVEIGMYPKTVEGVSGWQGCNLVEGNGSKCLTKEDFFHLCKMAAILATLQAAYTDFKFVGKETKEIFEREALLGVSLTGWMNSPDVLFDEKVLQEGAKLVKETNREVAKMLGIRPAARTTCVKPAGNASVLLGTASGIHPEHSKRYIRNIQINKSQEVSDIIKKFNPYMIEESVWSSLKTDNVISFPVITPKNSVYKADLSGTEFLERVKLVQSNWVESGTDMSLCVDPTVRHNVSNTVSVRDGEWDEVATYIFNNREYFTGVSLIGESGDKDYFQAPNIEVLTPREMVRKYGEASLFASGLITDASNGFNNLWEATRIAIDNHDESSQELKDIRSDWIRRFRKFADNFFNGDLKKTEYCLKDVYILYKWMKIQINLKDINLEEHLKIAKSIDIDTMAAQACAGGACEI